MKKLIISLIVIIISLLNIKAQIPLADTSQVKKFFKTTTYFVKDANIFSDFNYYISQAAKKTWTITPYKVISYDEYKKIKNTQDKSFVMTTIIFPEKQPDLKYEFLTVLLGGYGSKLGSDGGEMPVLGAIPLGFYGNDENFYFYKLPSFLLFLQKHIDVASKNPKFKEQNYLKYYNRNIPKLKNKTLVFSLDQIDESIRSGDIKKYYPGNIKILKQEEIQKLIEQNDTSIVFAHIVSAPIHEVEEEEIKGYCYKMLFDTKGNLYYFDWHKLNKAQVNVFSKQNFIKLGKKIAKK